MTARVKCKLLSSTKTLSSILAAADFGSAMIADFSSWNFAETSGLTRGIDKKCVSGVLQIQNLAGSLFSGKQDEVESATVGQ